jgi:hypothetical protein
LPEASIQRLAAESTTRSTSPSAVREFTIEQVVATAGDGNPKDGSVCSHELRDYLAQTESERLAKYVDQCLTARFDKSGMVLQDLVNELGRRLDYKVTNGRYQGTINLIGYDGIWLAPEANTLIAEVKTTDAYRISLDTIAGYRQKLTTSGSLTGATSILIVVGRQETGELEAQIRGSRHAWDIRLISADALIKLVKLKENSADAETVRKIRSVLTPLEYTRLDALVDVMFTTAADVAPAVIEAETDIEKAEAVGTGPDPDLKHRAPASAPEKPTGTWVFTDPVLLQEQRELIMKAMGARMGMPLLKRSRALYWSADHSKRVVCTLSKKYARSTSDRYWYAFHPQWGEFLESSDEAYLTLGCMDLSQAFAIPYAIVRDMLPQLRTTADDNTKYWHIEIIHDATGAFEILLPKSSSRLDITTYSIKLS